MNKILFVCTGNICRSPGAEALLRHEVTKRGLNAKFEIDSAGTHSYHIGQSPSTHGVSVAKERGVSMAGLKARQVRENDFKDFDLIIAMDEGHRRILKELKPVNAHGKLVMFAEYCTKFDITDVPDPYYGGYQDYENMYDILEDGIAGMLQKYS